MAIFFLATFSINYIHGKLMGLNKGIKTENFNIHGYKKGKDSWVFHEILMGFLRFCNW